jgi:hypothetical protein
MMRKTSILGSWLRPSLGSAFQAPVSVSYCLSLGLGCLTLLGANTAPQGPCETLSTSMETAAAQLAAGQTSAAPQALGAILQEKGQPGFLRGLAYLIQAEAQASSKNRPKALATYQSMASDAQLPTFQRDEAKRRIQELERPGRGEKVRDPLAYRASLPTLPKPGRTLHVSPSGSEKGDGSKAKPYGSLIQAREAIRTWKKEKSLPKGGVTVLVHGGTFRNQAPLELTAEDSGSKEAPIVYRAAPGESPVFSGGMPISHWEPVRDANVKAKLDPAIADQVRQADLKALGILDYGDPTQLRAQPVLYLDGQPQTLARWPNEGFVKTGDVLGKDTFKVYDNTTGCKEGLFKYEGDRPTRWAGEADVRLYGYWFWDWFEEFQKVDSIDAANRQFTLAKPFSSYGYRKNQRYYALNLLCELDRPGEWYLDHKNGVLYWLPPEKLDLSKAATVLSVQSRPFVSMKDATNVILLGLTFQEGRGDGITLNGGSDCLIAGCTLRRCGGDAIILEGGTHHGIFGCDLYTLGCGGTRVAGGDRKTLTPGHHFVENCHVHDISLVKRTYTPAVLLDGVGNRIAHNLFEQIPSSAMRIEGNDHLIELNLVRQVVQESDDQGGIDMFGNPTYRGVVIRWNRWSDIRGGTHNGAAGVRLDDMISGVTLHGNVFERCGSVIFGGLQIHGGKENLVDNNLFVDCFAGISFTRWGEKRWNEAVQPFLATASKPPYSEKYPQLLELKDRADINQISRNVFARCGQVFLRDGKTQQCVLNWVTEKGIAPESLTSADRVHKDASLRKVWFSPIPVGEMGPYPHPWKATASK